MYTDEELEAMLADLCPRFGEGSVHSTTLRARAERKGII
jgi:hypothetical protein